MADEARWMWKAFITAPENAHLLKRYAKSAKEPAPLFERIGEDLASSNEEVRKTAYDALLAAMPELTSIFHEREMREPGWRDRKGKDQKMVNQGEDILKFLHRKFVKEHRFNIHNGHRKDPRPLVNRIALNWQRDEQRKRRREVSLDNDVVLKIPDPTRTVEDTVLENIAYEECKREIRSLSFLRGEDEFGLFETVFVDHKPFTEVLESNGIRSKRNLDQRFSRSRKKFVAERDAVFTALLISSGNFEFGLRGIIPRSSKFPERSEWWINLAKSSIQPGPWLKGKVADGKNSVAVRALTRGFRDTPGHIYFVALHKDYRYTDRAPDLIIAHEAPPLGTYSVDWRSFDYVYKLLDAKLRYERYCSSPLGPHPTELPSINEAVGEVRDNYNIWLISYSKLTKSLRDHLT